MDPGGWSKENMMKYNGVVKGGGIGMNVTKIFHIKRYIGLFGPGK